MLNLQTILLTIGVGHIALGLLVQTVAGNAFQHRYLAVWVWVQVITGLALLMIALRGFVPDVMTYQMGNILLYLGFAAELLVFRYYAYKEWHWRSTGALAILAIGAYLVDVTFLTPASPGPNAVLIGTLALVLFSALSAWALIRSPRRKTPILIIIIAGALLLTVTGMFRIVSMVGSGEYTLFAPVLANQLFFLAGLIRLMTSGFGFLLLVKEDLDEELMQLTLTDSLTGLDNRRAFFKRADVAIHLCRRLKQPVILMMLDIDRFKVINDTHGHAIGDLVLQKVAAATRDALRNVDICARIGGEEFAVVLPAAELPAAVGAGERIRMSVAELRIPAGAKEITTTISIGVTQVGPEDSVDEAMIRADRALYEAKHAGRDRIAIG